VPGLVALILAAVAFVTAVLPFTAGFAWLPAVAAIVLAIVGLTRRGRPKGTSIAGLIVGIVAWLVAIVVTVVAFFLGVSAGVGDALDEIPVPESPLTGDTVALGQPVANSDGVVFTLDAVECGLATTGADFFDETPVGQFCRVDFSVRNDGTESVSLLAGDITGYAGDAIYAADEATGRFGDDYFTTDLNPGLAASAVVFVDVPAGTQLDRIGFAPVLSFVEPVFSTVS
jgi:hypothetical protein